MINQKQKNVDGWMEQESCILQCIWGWSHQEEQGVAALNHMVDLW